MKLLFYFSFPLSFSPSCYVFYLPFSCFVFYFFSSTCSISFSSNFSSSSSSSFSVSFFYKYLYKYVSFTHYFFLSVFPTISTSALFYYCFCKFLPELFIFPVSTRFLRIPVISITVMLIQFAIEYQSETVSVILCLIFLSSILLSLCTL